MIPDSTIAKRGFQRALLVTLLACLLVAIAFAHMNIIGLYGYYRFCGYISYDDEGGNPEGRPDDYSYHYYFRHGWPTPFGEHEELWKYDVNPPYNVVKAGPPLLRQIIPSRWTSFRLDSWRGAVCDVFLSLVLVAATGTVVLRLERGRRWKKLQFSLGDMFCLITTTGMVLGLIYLDDRLTLDGVAVVDDLGTYGRLQDLPLFDRVAILVAVGCAVWLIVSTAMSRLSSRDGKG